MGKLCCKAVVMFYELGKRCCFKNIACLTIWEWQAFTSLASTFIHWRGQILVMTKSLQSHTSLLGCWVTIGTVEEYIIIEREVCQELTCGRQHVVGDVLFMCSSTVVHLCMFW